MNSIFVYYKTRLHSNIIIQSNVELYLYGTSHSGQVLCLFSSIHACHSQYIILSQSSLFLRCILLRLLRHLVLLLNNYCSPARIAT
jgi:hypothetical protein